MYKWSDYRLALEFAKKLEGLVDDLTPQLGGNLDINGKGFTAQLTAGETLAAGDLCYLDTSGEMTKADADAESSAKSLLAISTGILSASETGEFVVKGYYDTTGLTLGDTLFLSATAGEWTSTSPSTSGQIVRVIGYAVTATQLFFDPDKTWLQIR